MKEEIEEKLERLEKRVDFLREHSDVDFEELEQNDLLRDAVERNFQVSLEIILDICSMVISYEDMEKPETYQQSISLLGGEVLPEEFAERFQNAAGFRNILVHHYADVDNERMYTYLTKHLNDFDTFAENISRYLKEKEE